MEGIFVVGLLLGAFITLLIATVILKKLVHRLVELNKTELNAVTSMYEFDNTKLKKAYTDMMSYVGNNKSRLSKKQRIELNNLWNKVLLNLPRKYEKCIICDIDYYTYNTLSMTEHKQALLEALNEIKDQDTIDETSLVKVSYHLYFILYNAGGKNE